MIQRLNIMNFAVRDIDEHWDGALDIVAGGYGTGGNGKVFVKFGDGSGGFGTATSSGVGGTLTRSA